MQVDLKEFIPDDKNFKANSEAIIGTTIQSMGTLKGYRVQICLNGLAVPSILCQTYEEAKELESRIWAKMNNPNIIGVIK